METEMYTERIAISQRAAAHIEVVRKEQGEAAAQEFETQYASAIIHLRDQLKKVFPGRKRAKVIQNRVDRLIRRRESREFYGQASCTKGCSHCCYQYVAVTNDEALLLSDHIKTGEQVAHLERQLQLSDIDEEWVGKPPDLTRCVFLGDDGLCTVYNDRPLACSSYFVTTDPEQCKMDRLGKRVASLFDVEVDLLVTAAYVVGGQGVMHKMLLKHVKNKKGIKWKTEEKSKNGQNTTPPT